MRRLTDSRRIIKLTLQSLLAVLAAIAIVIYGLSFLPRSVERMERSVALIEYVSYYEIDVAGKPVAWFKALNDSLLPKDLSLKADTTIMNKRYIGGVWVNKYSFMPSCRGLILTTFPDSTERERLALANKSVSSLLRKVADNMEKDIERMTRETDETEYFLSIHNVSDDGYNTIAEYSERLKDNIEKTEKILSVIKSSTAKTRLGMRMVKKYTLLYKDTSGAMKQMACNVLTKESRKPFCLLQTTDKKKPEDVAPTYLHCWLTPTVGRGDSIVIAAYPGCSDGHFSPNSSRPKAFVGATIGEMRHNMPPLIAPDGSAVYSERGFFIGVSYKGTIVKPDVFGFRLNKLR